MELTARCERYEGWWIISVPEVRGLYTQARRLDQVASAVRDSYHRLTGQAADDVSVNLVAELDERSSQLIEQAKQARGQLQAAEQVAATANRLVVKELAAQAMTLRDIGQLLGISYQRAHQLLG